MKIFLTGAGGFIGRAVCEHYLQKGHTVTAVGRRDFLAAPCSGEFVYIQGDLTQEGDWQRAVALSDVVINLAGESILQRWTRKNRDRMWQSRVQTTRHLVSAMGEGKTLINISATGFYGDRGADWISESDAAGTGFLADLCVAWETAAQSDSANLRVVIPRLGVVLGNGGALAKMLPVFKLGMGGKLGSGHQWMPWVHLHDVVRALDKFAEDASYRGVYNLVSPNPVTNRMFTEAMGKTLGVPVVAVVPKMVLSMVMGESSSVLLDSQRVAAAGLLQHNFNFKFPSLSDALHHIVAPTS